MSIEEQVELGKTALREAKVVVYAESGSLETVWTDTQGKQVAWCSGLPALCTSPYGKKCRCVHFSINWMVVRKRSDPFMTDEDIAVDEQLEAWVNQQPFTTIECVSLGQYMTRGTWHPTRNRWMWGPKQNRH